MPRLTLEQRERQRHNHQVITLTAIAIIAFLLIQALPVTPEQQQVCLSQGQPIDCHLLAND